MKVVLQVKHVTSPCIKDKIACSAMCYIFTMNEVFWFYSFH